MGLCDIGAMPHHAAESGWPDRTDIFGPGDIWYFPRGWGHSIQGIGPGECHFILIFDNGDFSEDHTFSITDWLAHTPKEVVRQNLGVGADVVARMPKGEAYFANGPVPNDRSFDAAARGYPELVSQHRYPLLAQQPRRIPGCGCKSPPIIQKALLHKRLCCPGKVGRTRVLAHSDGLARRCIRSADVER